ncbi:ZrgA family zinc uptake protein [Alteromonas australica]|uniref:ZrgA family zinc uptake protein n=1 Tax=Alteromonas australica TaxID=589873 RepID=UPI0035C78FDE
MSVSFLIRTFTLGVAGLVTIAGAMLMIGSAQAAENEHRHGQGSLQILQAENQWQLTLSLPLDDAFGFEHAPETDEQKSHIRHFVVQAESFDTFIKMQGNCSLQGATVNLPWPFYADGEPPRHSENAHNERMHEEVHAHKDVEAVYQIGCEEAIESITVNVPAISPSLVSIDAQWATEKGQGMQIITPNDNTLFLRRKN